MTVSRCQASCLEVTVGAALARECGAHRQCNMCWNVCEKLLTDTVSWAPVCEHVHDPTLCVSTDSLIPIFSTICYSINLRCSVLSITFYYCIHTRRTNLNSMYSESALKTQYNFQVYLVCCSSIDEKLCLKLTFVMYVSCVSASGMPHCLSVHVHCFPSHSLP